MLSNIWDKVYLYFGSCVLQAWFKGMIGFIYEVGTYWERDCYSWCGCFIRMLGLAFTLGQHLVASYSLVLTCHMAQSVYCGLFPTCFHQWLMTAWSVGAETAGELMHTNISISFGVSWALWWGGTFPKQPELYWAPSAGVGQPVASPHTNTAAAPCALLLYKRKKKAPSHASHAVLFYLEVQDLVLFKAEVPKVCTVVP